jgi:hypothetical protein
VLRASASGFSFKNLAGALLAQERLDAEERRAQRHAEKLRTSCGRDDSPASRTNRDAEKVSLFVIPNEVRDLSA